MTTHRPLNLQRMVLLTGGMLDRPAAKTALNMIRYRPGDVLAVLDSVHAGKTCQDVLGWGGPIPVVASVNEAEGADSLVIGIAPPGGKLPETMREAVRSAIQRRMTIVSGLHDFLALDHEFTGMAELHGATLLDLRRNQERDVLHGQGWDESCLRVLTVGHDCSVGKMLVSVELTRALQRIGQDAAFLATGQTGILIAGDGCPVDAVVADFLNGAVERLVLRHQPHRILMIEGQGSIVHPRYSPVTLGLLHGSRPDAMILCYEVGRETVYGMDEVRLPGLARFIDLYETMAGMVHPSKVIGVGMNSRRVDADRARLEREKVRDALCLPVCDVIRDGPDELVQAVLGYGRAVGKLEGAIHQI